MPHIFLSYHHQHQKTAVKLRDALKSRGFKPSFDRDDEERLFHGEMEKGIEKASVVIMCMSSPYKTSENCKKEIEYAERLKKPIIPICVEYGFKPSGWLELASGSKMVIDFSDQKNFNEKFEQLLKELTAKKIRIKKKRTEEMAHILLSHHHQHQKTVMRLRDALKSRGFKTWFHEDNSVDVPQEKMEKVIENASVVIMCMSAPYQATENFKEEIEYAEWLEKPIIPIIVEYCFKPSEWLEHASESKTVIDFSYQNKFNESFEQLLEELTAMKIKEEDVGNGGGANDEDGEDHEVLR